MNRYLSERVKKRDMESSSGRVERESIERPNRKRAMIWPRRAVWRGREGGWLCCLRPGAASVFARAAADVAEAGPRPAAATRQATNVLCCLLSSPRPFVIGSGRFDRNCFRCSAGHSTPAAHTGLEHDRDWRAVGHESGKERREGGGEEF